MHEFSLMADLLRKIESLAQQEDNAKVVGIKVKLGALSHISEEHFREHFEQAIGGTVADGAKLDVEVLTDVDDPQAQDIILDSIDVAQ